MTVNYLIIIVLSQSSAANFPLGLIHIIGPVISIISKKRQLTEFLLHFRQHNNGNRKAFKCCGVLAFLYHMASSSKGAINHCKQRPSLDCWKKTAFESITSAIGLKILSFIC